jgi:cytochrome c biogenesis protein CcdA
MMVAVEGNFAYSFVLGVLAAVNPCGFVLLPTYLMFFLGLEGSRPADSQRTTLARALRVGLATSSGFVALFLVVGTISRLFTNAIERNAKYASIVIGIGLVVMGVAMLAGWKPRIITPHLATGKTRTVGSMFLFGVAYAIASIGCTIGFLTSVILGSINVHGFASGLLSIVLYGVGMGAIVTALTVSFAFAKGGLLRIMRNGMRHLDRISAVLVLLTGFYLTWYWYAAIDERDYGSFVSRVERWQSDVATFLQRQGAWKLAFVFGATIAAAVAVVLLGTRRRSEDSGA